MSRMLLRQLLGLVLSGALASCSGSTSSGIPKAPHGTSATGRLTSATFTIKWTNPTAPAAIRRKDTISPAAQSITVAINGKSVATATRGPNPTQQIALDAPVGIDQFVFSVYDQPAGEGHMLGSAQVNQQIIDGAANVVSAAIQALCSATNVSQGVGLGHPVYVSTGVYAPTLSTFVVVGAPSGPPASLVVEPEDVDGDVIITGTGGTVAVSSSGAGVRVTSVDGSHVALSPQGGASLSSPGTTVNVAAAGCPATTFIAGESPAIYAQGLNGNVNIFDWYGDLVSGSTIAAGDTLIGYDIASSRLIALNEVSGAVSTYDVTLVTRGSLYSIRPNSLAAWSNDLQAVVATVPSSSPATYYTGSNGAYTTLGVSNSSGSTLDIATASDSSATIAYATDGTKVFSINVETKGATQFVTPPAAGGIRSLAVNDDFDQLLIFNAATPYVSVYTLALAPVSSSNDGFLYPASIGAVDTDGDDAYGFESPSGLIEASDSSGTAIPGFGNIGPGGGGALVVVSTDEN